MTDCTENGRVIVTYGRSLIALMIAQSLGSRGVEIIGCDDIDMTVLSFSKFSKKHAVYASPEKDEDRFINDLVTIVKKYKPEDDRPYVLIPAFNDALVISRHKDRFQGLITVACPDHESIERVDSKDRFAETADKHDVESPDTWLPGNEDELDEILNEIRFPVFIKPPNDVGGRGISKQENAKDLKKSFHDLQKRYPGEQILIQSMAKGTDYCFCGLFEHGELKASMVYHNMQKFPKEAGPGVVRETVESERFDVIARKLMAPLKWHGVAEIDFLWDENENNAPTMIEVNPRFWAGLDHSIKSEIDFPWLLYRMFVDGHVPPQDEAKIGHKTSLPGLTTLARIEGLFKDAINLEDLEKSWPEIRLHLKEKDVKMAGTLFLDALEGTISLDEAYSTFKTMLKESKQAEKISYARDDPFIGLGALFILGSLMRHGKLPPEITR